VTAATAATAAAATAADKQVRHGKQRVAFRQPTFNILLTSCYQTPTRTDTHRFSSAPGGFHTQKRIHVRGPVLSKQPLHISVLVLPLPKLKATL
jgi:hypothetical protein